MDGSIRLDQEGGRSKVGVVLGGSQKPCRRRQIVNVPKAPKKSQHKESREQRQASIDPIGGPTQVESIDRPIEARKIRRGKKQYVY